MSTEPEVEEKSAASELGEHRWAVLSERGCEATRLDYEDASQLVRRLRGEGMCGLCIITETAASHLPTAKISADEIHAGNNSKPPRRAAKKRES